jgi:hypothetical protein
MGSYVVGKIFLEIGTPGRGPVFRVFKEGG